MVDGAIHKATVCLDKNKNDACDSGEPFAITKADGTANLTVDNADAGQFPILAIIGTDAIDADNGPVTVPYVMKAPADKPGFVSPLTTMVQNVVENTGSTSTAAETLVKAQTGINLSLFEDFTKSNTDDAKAAGTLARMVVVTTQQQATAIASAVGTPDVSGATISKQDLDKAIQKRLLEILPTLMEKLADPSIASAGTDLTAKNAAIAALATSLLSTNGLTSTSVATTVAIDKQVAGGGSTSASSGVAAVASGSLSRLTFTSVSDWFMRATTSTVAQLTPNTDGTTKYRAASTVQPVGGSAYSWGNGSRPERGSDLHWTGSAWAYCPINFEHSSSVRDANGFSTSNYCNNLEVGRSARAATFDIAGRTMLDVYNQIVGAGYTNIKIQNAAGVLGASTFPTGSKLHYQPTTVLTTAITYSPGAGDYVYTVDAAYAAGDSVACNNTNLPDDVADGITLEDLIATRRGTPCKFDPTEPISGLNGVSLSSGSRNEAWGGTTLDMGTLGTAPTFSTASQASSYYTTNTRLRVAFAANNVANYYSCQQRYNNFTRNCNLIGTGTYAIQTLGDARVMTFSGLPAIFSAQNWVGTFVERGGHIYYGYKNRPTSDNKARFNLTASNALFGQLGMPAVDPDAPTVLTQGSFAGTYTGTYSGTYSGYFNFTVSPTGTHSCSGNDTLGVFFACAFNNIDSISGTMANLTIGAASTGAIFTGTIDYTTGLVNGTWTKTGGADGTFAGSRY